VNHTLTTLAGDMAAVLELIDQAQGEINPTVEEWLTDITQNLATKVDAYVGRLDHLSLVADICRKRAQDAQKAAQTIERMQGQLEARIKDTITALGVSELSGNEWRYKISKTKGALVINESELPPLYMMTVTTQSPDKDRVRDALDKGATIPGAMIRPGFQLRKYRGSK